MNTNNLTQAEKIDYILNVMNKKKNKALTNNQINEYIDNVFNTVNKIEKENKKEKKVKKVKKLIKKKGYNSKKMFKYINYVLGELDTKINIIKNARYVGKDIISIRVKEDIENDYRFGVNEVKVLSQRLSNRLYDKGINAKLSTAMLYGDLGWRSGYLRNVGEEVVLYDPNRLYNLDVPVEEPEYIPKFNFYIALGNNNAGGDDDNLNDCLYRCLKYYIFNIEDYFKSPSEFKKFLGLKRDDKVPIDKIDIIEKKLKTFQINVRGDYIRTSTINSNKVINITLKNEHYEPEKINRNLAKYIKFQEKIPILYDSKTFEAYNGEKRIILTKELFNEYGKKTSEYILVKRDKKGRDKEGNLITLPIEQEYKEYIEAADKLKEETKGLINLYKSGSFYNAALDLFDRISKSIQTDQILQDEAIWIKLSSFSALIYANKGYEGELYGYDVKSMYPSFMTLSTLKFPVKRGEFKIIESFDKEYFEFGIYRCVITLSDDENINKLFKTNVHHYYTSIDLTNAKRLGLEIELIQDDKPNFLYWSRDKLITFGEVFKQYVDILFPLKEKKVEKSKNILNILWGALSEVDKRKFFVNDTFEIDEDEELFELYPSNDDKGHIIRTNKINAFYKTQFARLCPFITSQGRKRMTDILYDEREHIQRILTDGFLTSKKIHENRDVKLGELKYEGYTENGNIKNCLNKIELN